MRNIIMVGFLYSNAALAHEGHGALPLHLHWWEYALMAAVFAGVALYFVKK